MAVAHNDLHEPDGSDENSVFGLVGTKPAARGGRPPRGTGPQEPDSHGVVSEELHYLFGVSPGVARRDLRRAYHSRMRMIAEVDQGEFRDPMLRARATLLARAYNALIRCDKHR